MLKLYKTRSIFQIISKVIFLFCPIAPTVFTYTYQINVSFQRFEYRYSMVGSLYFIYVRILQLVQKKTSLIFVIDQMRHNYDRTLTFELLSHWRWRQCQFWKVPQAMKPVMLLLHDLRTPLNALFIPVSPDWPLVLICFLFVWLV